MTTTTTQARRAQAQAEVQAYEVAFRADMAAGAATAGEVAEHYGCTRSMAARILIRAAAAANGAA